MFCLIARDVDDCRSSRSERDISIIRQTVDITAVYLGAAIRRENSRYFSILYRHHNLAKLNSESKTQGGNGGSWTYKVSIKIRRRSYIFWRHFSNPNKTPVLHATFESSSSISIKWDAYLTFLTPLSIKWDAYLTFLTFIIFDNYAISAITFGWFTQNTLFFLYAQLSTETLKYCYIFFEKHTYKSMFLFHKCFHNVAKIMRILPPNGGPQINRCDVYRQRFTYRYLGHRPNHRTQ